MQVKCTQCGGELFDDTNALLNTRGMTFFGFDWANSGASLLVCRACGHIEWFVKAPEAL